MRRVDSSGAPRPHRNRCRVFSHPPTAISCRSASLASCNAIRPCSLAYPLEDILMLNGYLPTLPQDVLLNMGVLFYSKNGVATKLGVTEGAPDFDPGVEFQDLEFDGKRCRLKAQTRKVGFKPVIKGTIKEFGSNYSGGQIALLEA